MSSLENKTLVITGALGGLGRQVCDVAESQGAKVIRLDIVSDDQIANSHAVDLTDLEATKACVQGLGQFDALINLAGGFAMGKESWQDDEDDWALMFKLNVTTMRNAVKSATPQLIESKGSIVNVGAYAALQGQGLMGAYIASKSVVMRQTETLAEELKGQGVNVNAVLPTIIDTKPNRDAMPDADPADWVSPANLANVICFLASDAASAVHGALVPVRGLS